MEDQSSRDMAHVGEGTSTAARMKEEVAETAKGLKEKVTDIGRQTVDRIDAQREPAATTLSRTASALHQQGDKASTVAHATAEKLEATADYVRQNDVKAMAEDVGELVKRYPGQALAAAVVVGFLVGRVFSTQ